MGSQEVAEARRVRLQFAEGVLRGVAIARFTIQRHAIAMGMPVAAFNAGIQGAGFAVQVPGSQL